MNRNRGFTLVELLVVIGIIALLIGLLLPALSKAQKSARSVKDNNNIKQIHGAMVIFAESSQGRMPTPGLINREIDPFTNAQMPGRGPEDVALNHTGPLYSALIAQEYFQPNLVVGPTEVNELIVEDDNYDFSLYDPSSDTYWDPNFVADLTNVSNTSYAHMALCGERKKVQWQNTQNGRIPAIGTRGTGGTYNGGPGGAITGAAYSDSPTLQLHGSEKEWQGNVAFMDNHTEVLNNFFPPNTTYEPREALSTPERDNIYSAEFTDFQSSNGEASGDGWLVISLEGTTRNTVEEVFDES
jgi:prepilin-type N-terminal cleavage/methylation domain-containing protein